MFEYFLVGGESKFRAFEGSHIFVAKDACTLMVINLIFGWAFVQ
jgi:hypothetical protein